jgi:hypothetical protein
MRKNFDALAAVVIATCFSAAPAAALQCKNETIKAPPPSAAPDRATATTLTREVWRNMVILRFGPAWSNFNLAKSRKVSCPRSPNGIGGYVYTCIVSGRPCRP